MTISRFDISTLISALQNGHTLLVPDHRSRDAICYSYANHQSQLRKAWRAPEVYAIDIWLMSQSEMLADLGVPPFHQTRIMNKHEELSLWQEIIESSNSIYPLINPVETAQAVSRTYRLQQQWINPQGLEQLAGYDHVPDVAAYQQWADRFKASCKVHGVMVLADAIIALIEALSKSEIRLPPQLLLINFFNPPPLYGKLFQALASHSKLTEIESSAQDQERPTPDMLQRCYFVDLDDEIRACADWANQLQQSNPDAHIAIVTKNLDENSELAALIENQLCRDINPATSLGIDYYDPPFNLFSQGPALSADQSINTALMILALNQKTQITANFCQLVSSPFIVGAEEESENRIRLEYHYRRFSEANTNLADLRQPMLQEEKDYHCPVLAKALLAFQQSLRRNQTTDSSLGWAAVFSEQLEIMGWPQAQHRIGKQQTAQQWQECLLIFQQASELLGKLSFSTAYHHLKQICNQTAQLSPFKPDCSVSVISATDAVGLHYSHLWLLAMDDQNWPGPARLDPFLPIDLQRQLDMPGNSSGWQLDHAKVLLTQLCNSTSRELVVSHHQQDGDQILHESPVIKYHPLFNKVDLLDGTIAHKESAVQIDVEFTLEQIVDCQPVPLAVDETVRGGSSLLSDQSNCPFKAFARHRLAVNALPEFEIGLDNRARGIALHTALQKLWGELTSHEALLSCKDDELSKFVDAGIDSAISWLRNNYPHAMTPAIVKIEIKRLKTILHAYLQSEKKRSPFTVIATEKRSNIDFDKITLALSVDRIDQLEDSSLVLIDYKTGKQTNFKWFDERPLDLQLPLYQMAIARELDENVEAVLISQINAENIQYVGESNSPELHPDLSKRQRRKQFPGSWSQLQDFWNTNISNIAQEVEQGLCTVTPTSVVSSCQYCELSRLCRINESVDPIGLDEIGINGDD